MRKLREHERPRRPDQKRLGSDEQNLAVNARGSDTDSVEAITTVDDGGVGSKDLEGSVFDSTTALVKSKSYGLKINPLRGIEIVAYKPVEVTAHRYIIDILLLKFQSGESFVKVGEATDTFQPLQVENRSIGPLCRELSEETQTVASAILEKSPELLESHASLSGSSLIPGLETYSANLLLSKVTYHRFNGKSVRFWISPILLTSSRLKNDLGEEKAWIPALGGSGKNDVDIVHVGNFPSYLDFREKEVRALGRELFDSDAEPVRFPSAIRLFRFLTILASLILLVGYLTYALSLGTGASVAGLGTLLATMVEPVGGLRLLRSYRQLNRENDVASSGSPRITPEQVVAHEAEFTPDELSYLYSKYGGAELSKLRKEFRHQRIIELTKKAKDIFSKVRKLEKEEFNSEVVLSLDRAARSLLTATLLSIGVDTQGRDITEWIPLLRKNIPSTKLEDMKSLWMLRDRINRWHDATKNEAKRAKQIAEPIIDDALDYLNGFLRKQDLPYSLPTLRHPQSGNYTDSSVLMAQYHQILRTALSAAYSSRSNGEAEKHIYNLERSLGAAVRIKILELSDKAPMALTLPLLVRELDKLNFKFNQDEILKWLDKLKNGEIRTVDEAEEFESLCIESLETLGVMSGLTGDEESLLKLESLRTKPLSALSEKQPRRLSEVAPAGIGYSSEQKSDSSQIRLSSEVPNAVQYLKFLLNVADDKELLDVGSAGICLIEAKRRFGTKTTETSKDEQDGQPAINQGTYSDALSRAVEIGEETQSDSSGSKTVSEELDSIMGSLGLSSTHEDFLQRDKAAQDLVVHSQTDAPNQVLPFEHLGDFKKIVSRCPLPIEASFLSDDEASREVYCSMKALVAEYHNRAAFISVGSASEDIARECKIKSYPTVLVFSGGTMIGELKALETDQLEHDLLKTIGSTASAGSRDAFDDGREEAHGGTDEDTDTKPAADIDKLEVTDSP